MISAATIIRGLGGDPATGMCRCPAHDDKTPSLSVTERNGKVLVKCFAECSQDAVIAALRARGLWSGRSISRRAPTTEEAADEPSSWPPRPRPAGRVIDLPSETEEKARALLDAAERSAEQPVAYLDWRGLAISSKALRLIDMPTSLKITGWRFPAMVAPVEKGGRIVGVQCTFLTIDAKRNVRRKNGKNLRISYGPVGGGLVMLGRAAADRPFIIGEGVETTLSAMELTGLPGGAALGAESLEEAEPPACSEIIIAADNDKPGIKAARKLALRLASAGRLVRIAVPATEGGDWNDELRADGADRAGLARQIIEPAPYEAETEAVVAALAGLSGVEYDQRRNQAAIDLGIRRSTLDAAVDAARGQRAPSEGGFLAPVALWDDPVDGADLLTELTDVFERHFILPKRAAETLALWVIHAHAHDAARHSPILFISSPTKRCGKTNLLSLLAMLVPKALSAANVTPATVFRAIDRWKPTMLIDKSDTFIADKSELRGVLNSGHTRSQAYVLRCVGDDLVPKQFATWSPKAFAAIGRLHPTLEDRSIKVELRRKLKVDKVKRLPVRDDAYDDLRRKAARWAADNAPALERARPKLPADLHDRARDNWYPLLAIAERCGDPWPTWARNAARALSALDDDEGHAEMLLRDLRMIFDREGADALWSEDLIEALTAIEGRPWADYRQGKPLTTHGLARLLKPFKVMPRRVRPSGESQWRSGYERRRLAPIWKRYLDADGDPISQPAKKQENQQVALNSDRNAVQIEMARQPLKTKRYRGLGD